MYCHHQWNDEGNVTFFINHLTTFQMKMLQFFSIFNLKIKIEGSLLNSWNGNVQIIRYSEKKRISFYSNMPQLSNLQERPVHVSE